MGLVAAGDHRPKDQSGQKKARVTEDGTRARQDLLLLK
jgi:hypothetical protein